MVIDLAFYKCFFCGRRFASDPETHEIEFLHEWKVAVCRRCLTSNPHGLGSDHPALPRLVAAGIAVKADANGFVPWPDNPPYKSPASSAR